MIVRDKANDYALYYYNAVSLPSLASFPPKVFTHPTSANVTCALSGNGAMLAIGFRSSPDPGRGFSVVDLAAASIQPMMQRSHVVTRGRSAHPIDPERPLRLELDYAGKRLAQAVPEHEPALGVIRIGKSDRFRRDHLGGMSAVALEHNGALVAYASREVPTGARGRLRFDYLSPASDGTELVEVLDTQTLECELPDVIAMSFSHDRRKLACLSSTGAYEIVPVP